MKRFLSIFSTTDVRNIIAVLTIVGCFLFMFILSLRPIPSENKDVIQILGSGFIIGGGMAVYGYLFNASKRNKEQKETDSE